MDVAEGWTKMLYVAPESLTKAENIDFLKSVRISSVAVDEAHRAPRKWGYDFRPEYRRIKPIIKGIADVPIMALTATATPKVQQDIQKNLNMVDAVVLRASFNRDNLFYEVRPKKDALKQIVRHCLPECRRERHRLLPEPQEGRANCRDPQRQRHQGLALPRRDGQRTPQPHPRPVLDGRTWM